MSLSSLLSAIPIIGKPLSSLTGIVGDSISDIPVIGAVGKALSNDHKEKVAEDAATTAFERTMQQQSDQQAFNAAEAEKARQFNADESAANRAFQTSEREAAEAFNSSEAQIARQFNAGEAQKARDFELQMFNLENEYNSPAAQLQRMMAAGFMPRNGFDSIAASAGSPASAGSASPASISPQSGNMASSPMATSSMGSASPVSPVGYVDPSQARLNNAQAAKIESDTSIQEDLKPVIKALKHGELKVQDGVLRGQVSQRFLDDATAGQILQYTNLLYARTKETFEGIDSIRAQARLANSQSVLNEIDADWREKLSDANLRKALSDVGVNKARMEEAFANAAMIRDELYYNHLWGFDDRHYLAKAQTGLVGAQTGLTRAQTDKTMWDAKNSRLQFKFDNKAFKFRLGVLQTQSKQLEFDFNQQRRWDDVTRGVGLATQVVNSVSNCIQSVKGFSIKSEVPAAQYPGTSSYSFDY